MKIVIGGLSKTCGGTYGSGDSFTKKGVGIYV